MQASGRWTRQLRSQILEASTACPVESSGGEQVEEKTQDGFYNYIGDGVETGCQTQTWPGVLVTTRNCGVQASVAKRSSRGMQTERVRQLTPKGGGFGDNLTPNCMRTPPPFAYNHSGPNKGGLQSSRGAHGHDWLRQKQR